MIEQRLYSREDAATYLSKSRTEIDRLIRARTLVAKKDGRRTVIERSELDRFADRLPILGEAS